jgi:hypothetical protein
MKDAILAFFLNNSFRIMIIGFSISAAGIIFYSQVQRKDPVLSKLAFAVTAAGIGIYIVGRIALVIQRRQARQKQHKALKASTTEQKE